MSHHGRPDVFTVSTAAQHYAGTALTEAAIRRLARSGEIPCKRVGKKYLITATAIEKWLYGNSAQPHEYGAIQPVAERKNA